MLAAERQQKTFVRISALSEITAVVTDLPLGEAWREAAERDGFGIIDGGTAREDHGQPAHQARP